MTDIIRFKLTLILIFFYGCASFPDSQTLTTTDGEFSYFTDNKYTANKNSASAKPPTLVFESGLGDDMTSWQPVIEQAAQLGTVFTYNRAGFSGSDSKNSDRHGKVIVHELKALLAQADLPPPYILVGHSLGGAYMELYAKTFPDDVSGVVMVDPNSSKYAQPCKELKLDQCDPPTSMPYWAQLFFPKAIAGEIAGWRTTHQQINAIDTFPDVPLAVLTATHLHENLTGKEKLANDLYVKTHRELSEITNTSTFIRCDSCSHYIHHDEPELVLDAIKWVIDQAGHD